MRPSRPTVFDRRITTLGPRLYSRALSIMPERRRRRRPELEPRWLTIGETAEIPRALAFLAVP